MSLLFQGEWPSWDLEQGWWRAWWFEPAVATLSFAFWINYFWYWERQLGTSTARTFSETVHRQSSGPLLNSLGAYWMGIYIWKCLVPPVAPVIPDGLPVHSLAEFFYLLGEVLIGIILYDAVFFFIHWGLHEIPACRWMHAEHHRQARVPSPPDGSLVLRVECRDTLRHSWLDGTLQVLVNIAVQRRVGLWGGPVKSRAARLLHNIVVTGLLTESHTSSPFPRIGRRGCVGVRHHAAHHHHQPPPQPSPPHHDETGAPGQTTRAPSSTRYQPFFGYLDELRWHWIRNSSSSCSPHGPKSWS